MSLVKRVRAQRMGVTPLPQEKCSSEAHVNHESLIKWPVFSWPCTCISTITAFTASLRFLLLELHIDIPGVRQDTCTAGVELWQTPRAR
eukprot:1829306-Amphidinium_carterae.1